MMILHFHTRSGSHYQLDTDRKLLLGPGECVWRSYQDIIGPALGFQCTIAFSNLRENDVVITSKVISIEVANSE